MDEGLRAELVERAGRDQAARLSQGPGHGMAEWEAVVAPVDRDNTARLREIIGRHGWPGRRLAGDDGAHAAWLLAQHAPPELQEECLPLLEDAVTREDASPVDLAYLRDRVLTHRGEPQLYGTQYLIRNGVMELCARSAIPPGWTSGGPRSAWRRRPRTGRACWQPRDCPAGAQTTSRPADV